MKDYQEDGSEAARRRHAVYRVTVVGMVMNALLVAAKLTAGIVGRSAAMIADAVHSISDFATDVIVIIFVGISTQPRDESHDFGHGKFETLATVVIGIALAAAAASVVVKELLFRFTSRVGKREKSPAVIANAWHHRSDALSSVGALVGIGGAFALGDRWHVLDPIAAMAVSVLIGKTSVEMILPGIQELLESSLPAEVEREIQAIVRDVEGVQDPHNLRTRRVGSEIAIDLHIRMERGLTVETSHRTTQEIEDRLSERFGAGTMVSVHVEPVTPSDTDVVE